MIGRLGRRVVEAAVALFALLGFAFVPLGRRTALQHTVAIFSTPAATEAGRELMQAGGRLKQQVLGTIIAERARDHHGRDTHPASPENAMIAPIASIAPELPNEATQPAPIVAVTNQPDASVAYP